MSAKIKSETFWLYFIMDFDNIYAVGGWGDRHIFLDICWLCISVGEQEQWKCCNTSWNFNCLGTCCDGAGLLSWSHLWCSFQSCSYHCFCQYQKISIETGAPNSPSFNYHVEFFFIFLAKLIRKLEVKLVHDLQPTMLEKWISSSYLFWPFHICL